MRFSVRHFWQREQSTKPVMVAKMPVRQAVRCQRARISVIQRSKNLRDSLRPPEIKPATLVILKESVQGMYSTIPSSERALPSQAMSDSLSQLRLSLRLQSQTDLQNLRFLAMLYPTASFPGTTAIQDVFGLIGSTNTNSCSLSYDPISLGMATDVVSSTSQSTLYSFFPPEGTLSTAFSACFLVKHTPFTTANRGPAVSRNSWRFYSRVLGVQQTPWSASIWRFQLRSWSFVLKQYKPALLRREKAPKKSVFFKSSSINKIVLQCGSVQLQFTIRNLIQIVLECFVNQNQQFITSTPPTLSRTMPNYGDPKYWDKRYSENEGSMFDWLEDYQSLKPLLSSLIPSKSSRILIIGCGNAPLSEDLYDDGYQNVVNIDISSVVIKQMRERNCEKRPGMIYEVMDCTEMGAFGDDTFDVAIDKSTVDALLCGDNAYLMVAKMTREIQRVIKPDGGVYIAISYGKPESRAIHFERPHLSFVNKQFILYPADCTSEEQKEEKSHYIYVCRKQPGAEAVAAENWDRVVEQLKQEAEAAAAEYDGDSSGDEEKVGKSNKQKKGIHLRSYSQ
ncbi:hypothetical protein FGO68_gene3607 [Halteria grandinella]|uniref:Methyltransferase type 11 domain-containing protein n=1 Tax=Halteria grandinella TaxID=5974 RepID=A0A8J8T5K9_HALGN|nr:hypothetical protein FGO68_gene3607 [Halteria grandinella]